MGPNCSTITRIDIGVIEEKEEEEVKERED